MAEELEISPERSTEIIERPAAADIAGNADRRGRRQLCWATSSRTPRCRRPSDAASQHLLKEQLESDVLDSLTERERQGAAAALRPGRRRVPARWKKWAPHFGVTRERIRQIEAKALRKLRHPRRSSEAEGLPGLARPSLFRTTNSLSAQQIRATKKPRFRVVSSHQVNKEEIPGDDLFSRAVAHRVSSALERFTTVFGMGTGGTTPL